MFRALQRFAPLAFFAVSASAARYPSYGTLQTTNSSGVMNVVINNTYSSINLFDEHVQSDLANLIETLQVNDTNIRVVVFSSGNPEFFIGHLDITSFLPGYVSKLPNLNPGNPDMLFLEGLLWNITELPQATIAVIEGRARGIGNEFLMSCDMRFASLSPSVFFAQLETSLGLNPGGGGGMYLSQLMGRERAFEYVLASKDIDVEQRRLKTIQLILFLFTLRTPKALVDSNRSSNSVGTTPFCHPLPLLSDNWWVAAAKRLA
ncbi:ClpP/crotonase-like domain-containing protein [Mycena capillaripes]|nr:ClpP/crotonase-like domain-containing protein [Mycena capillaripes]